MSSKMEQAVELYAQYIKDNSTISRAVGMKILQDKLAMTPAGASTYHATIMKKLNPTGDQPTMKKSIPAKQKTSPKVVEVHPSQRQQYSKIYYRGDEIVFVIARYDPQDALNAQPQSPEAEEYVAGLLTFCVVGVPMGDCTVTQAKQQFELLTE